MKFPNKSPLFLLILGLSVLTISPQHLSAVEVKSIRLTPDASFIGEAANDLSGEYVAGVGDVNNDGFDDILIGAGDNDEGGNGAGKAYLILGCADVTQWNGSSPLDLSYANASFVGEKAGDWAGLGLAGAGDVNNDGFVDMLISAPGNDEGGSGAGKIYLILGRTDVSAWSDSSPLDLSYANASFVGEKAGDGAGGSGLAGVGDVNNDGFDDILIGAGNNDEGGDAAGKVYLILGRADVTQWNGSSPLDLSYANASFVGEEDMDLAGEYVAGAGDVNNDGFADILISADRNDEGGNGAGKVYLILGRADVTQWNGSSPLDLGYANASFIGEEAGDGAGFNGLAGAGDVNNDGFADLLIGAYDNDEGGVNAGQFYLIFGRADVTQWNGSSPLDLGYANASFHGPDTETYIGESLAGAGDINNDGYDDILSGVIRPDGPGRLYIILGQPTGQWMSDVNLDSSDAFIIGEVDFDAFGYAVAGAGDINNDSFADILVGAFGNDEGGSDAGKTYLALGGALAGRLSISILQIYADSRTIKITISVWNPQGNTVANAQMEVSNQTHVWTGSTNTTGQFEVSMAFTPLEFILEVQASDAPPYSSSSRNFIIQIDLPCNEPTTEIDSTTESTTSSPTTTTIPSTTITDEQTSTTTSAASPGSLLIESLIILGLSIGTQRYILQKKK
jgi:hypothetical protein